VFTKISPTITTAAAAANRIKVDMKDSFRWWLFGVPMRFERERAIGVATRTRNPVCFWAVRLSVRFGGGHLKNVLTGFTLSGVARLPLKVDAHLFLLSIMAGCGGGRLDAAPVIGKPSGMVAAPSVRPSRRAFPPRVVRILTGALVSRLSRRCSRRAREGLSKINPLWPGARSPPN
jgi:hypothetical protein